MRKLKSVLLASVLLCSLALPVVGGAAAGNTSGNDHTGESWENPTLPVETTIDVNDSEQIRVSVVNASDDVGVTITNNSTGNTTTTANLAPDDVVYLSVPNGTYDVTVSGASAGVTAENVTVEATTDSPTAGGGTGGSDDDGSTGLFGSNPLIFAGIIALLVGVGLVLGARDEGESVVDSLTGGD